MQSVPGGLLDLEHAPPPAVQATGRPDATAGPFRRFEAALVPAIYLTIGLASVRSFRFIHNKDEIAYISVAKHYADGNLLDGVNAYWAPMLSWLLAPLLALEIEPALAAKVLAVLIGLFVLLCVRRLTFTVDMRPGARWLVLLLAVPVLLSYSLAPFTPDLLHAGLLLLYISLVTDRSFPASRFAGAAAGVVGALLFFSKSYGLLFFLLHFTVVIGLRALMASERSTRRSLLRHGAVGLAVFFVLAAAWGALLGQKYGSFTLGVGGSYNHSIVGPHSPGRPIFYMGPVEPPPPAITSVWEEPHYFAQRLGRWSPLESWTAAKHQLRLLATNGRTTAEVFQQFSMLSVTILTAAVVLCMVSRRRTSTLTPLLWLLTIALYAGGYMLVYSEERYLWGLLLLTLVLGGHLLSMLLGTDLLARRGPTAMVCGVFAATTLIHPLPALFSRVGDGREVNAISEELRGSGLGGADIASSDDFGASNLVAFKLGARYWGQSPVGSSEVEAVERLQGTPVRFYLVWNSSPQPTHPAFTEVRQVRSGKVRLVVYSVS